MKEQINNITLTLPTTLIQIQGSGSVSVQLLWVIYIYFIKRLAHWKILIKYLEENECHEGHKIVFQNIIKVTNL